MTCSSLLQNPERSLVHLLVEHDGAAIARLFLLPAAVLVKADARPDHPRLAARAAGKVGGRSPVPPEPQQRS